MVIAYHAIFSAYGFWLPNDPRGSWSTFVASWEIFRYGKIVPAGTRFSRAWVEHDFRQRHAAKEALKFPPVTFDGLAARAIGQGFAKAVTSSAYRVLACAIMPDHVHLVVRRHAQSIERIVGHLKGRASSRLEEAGIHPLAAFRQKDGTLPTPWAERCWKVFLDSDADIQRAVKYVNNNPPCEGLPSQPWYFLESDEHADIERQNGG